ncbi:MAG: BLUF domain-containing protein [Roseococcus sp.]
MTQALHSIAYFSRSNLRGDEAELKAQVMDILSTAWRKNRQKELTGALLFSDGCFAQVLEGPREALEETFEEIECDPRHSDVTILHFHPVAERSFPGWSMAFAGEDEAVRARAISANALPSADSIQVDSRGKSFLDVLSDYVRRSDAADKKGGN